MELQLKTVSEAAAIWNLRFPAKDRGPNEVALLACEYFEDLKGDFTDEEFRRTNRLVVKRAQYWPKTDDFFKKREESAQMAARDNEEQSRRNLRLSYDASLSPEERQIEARRCALVWDVINKRKTADEAIEEMKLLADERFKN